MPRKWPEDPAFFAKTSNIHQFFFIFNSTTGRNVALNPFSHTVNQLLFVANLFSDLSKKNRFAAINFAIQMWIIKREY